MIKDNRAIDPLIISIKGKNNDYDNAAEKALYMIDPFWINTEAAKKSANLIVPALKNKDRNVRISAIRALGIMKNAQTINPLINTLKDKDKDVRRATTEVLGIMKNKQTIKPLIAALKGGDYFATDALDSIDSIWRKNEIVKKTVLILIAELKSENDGERETAIKTLGRIKDISAIKPLEAALQDKNSQIRSEAEFSLYLIDPNWKDKK